MGELYFQKENAPQGAQAVSSDNPLPIINSPHARIHQGKGFFCGHYVAALEDAVIMDILIQTGNGSLHSVIDVAAGANTTFQIFENVTFSDEGVALGIFNKARWSGNPSLATATHTPVITGFGTAFPIRLIPGGVGKTAGGGKDGSYDGEFNMKANTNYLFRSINISGLEEPISTSLEWYEPTPTT